jgi:hypothetical protein
MDMKWTTKGRVKKAGNTLVVIVIFILAMMGVGMVIKTFTHVDPNGANCVDASYDRQGQTCLDYDTGN